MQRSSPSRRLTLITGKGGVGKSTLVAALALDAAAAGRAPLIVELGHRASVAGVLGCAGFGYAPAHLADGVYGTRVSVGPALEDYARRHAPLGGITRRALRRPSLARFLAAAPGVEEVLVLDRIEALLAERWSPILVDLDSTGHALMFLDLPAVFEDLAPAGPVRALLDRAVELLRDPGRTDLRVVCRPELLSVRETLELCARIEAGGRVRVSRIYVNGVPAPPLRNRDRPTLEALRARAADPDLREDLHALDRALARHDRARAMVARLAAAGVDVLELPQLEGRPDRASLRALGALAR